MTPNPWGTAEQVGALVAFHRANRPAQPPPLDWHSLVHVSDAALFARRAIILATATITDRAALAEFRAIERELRRRAWLEDGER